MATQEYGRLPQGTLSDAQALPNATSADSTNMVYVGTPTNGLLKIVLYANTDIAVDSAKVFDVELEVGTTNTAASAVPPFSYNNAGTQTAQTNAHMYLVHKTATDGALAFTAGDIIAELTIPDEIMGLMNYDWVQLKYNTDEDLSLQKVSAFVVTQV